MSRFLFGLVIVLGALVAWSRLEQAFSDQDSEPVSIPSGAQIPVQAGRAVSRPPASPVSGPVQRIVEEKVAPDLPQSAQLSRLAVRRRIHRDGINTYFDSLLILSDSVIRRWPDRRGAPLMVAVTGQETPGVSARHHQLLVEAVGRWEALRLGLRFAIISDTTAADILVHWIDRFDVDRSGQADVQWTSDGKIFSARVILALKTRAGVPLPLHALAAVATHELGHAIGLPHSGDVRDVLHPTTAKAEPTVRDQSTARLLYALPPGSVKP